MVRAARVRHRHLAFAVADGHHLPLSGQRPFDVIILSDLVNDAWDIQTILAAASAVAHRRTRLVINFYSRLWAPPLALAQWLRLANPTLRQNWVTVEDMDNLLELAGWTQLRNWTEILLPVDVPLVAALANRFLVRLWPIHHLALSNFVLARPMPCPVDRELRVSVVVPARNEAGNIPAVFERTPEMGAGTELVFVEGHSADDTYAVIAQEMERHPRRRSLLLRQSGRGKGDAVRRGFEAASGDVLMILDADLTMPPEDLPRYFEVLRSGRGEFANGVRLVYPQEAEAMRPLNFLGNKFFSLVFTWLLGQAIKDTLCGTKVMFAEDYELLALNRAYFGNFDPFGDFDLLFGAAKLNMAIVEVPVRYRERTYGSTNIRRWRDGLLLLRMALLAAARLKFV
jgi:hypothetical protein